MLSAKSLSPALLGCAAQGGCSLGTWGPPGLVLVSPQLCLGPLSSSPRDAPLNGLITLNYLRSSWSAGSAAQDMGWLSQSWRALEKVPEPPEPKPPEWGSRGTKTLKDRSPEPRSLWPRSPEWRTSQLVSLKSWSPKPMSPHWRSLHPIALKSWSPKTPFPGWKSPYPLSLKSWSPKPMSPDWGAPYPMFPKPRSPPGAAKGPSSPGHPRDVLEEGAGQRGTVTSRATPSCGESLGDNGVCHRPLCWWNWGGGAMVFPQHSRDTWKSGITHIPAGRAWGGQGCAQHPSGGHKQLKGLWEHHPGVTHPPGQGWSWSSPGNREDLPENSRGAGSAEGPSCGTPQLKVPAHPMPLETPQYGQEEPPASPFPSLYSFTLWHCFCFVEIYKIIIHTKNLSPKNPYFAIKCNKLAINKKVV